MPRGDHVRRIPLDALEIETRIAAGEQALQALIMFARDSAGTLEAHDAEQGLVTRRRPIGVAAMTRAFAQRGTGDVGPAVTRAAGVFLPREPTLRGRDDGSRCGTCAGARTCAHTPGAPGICPLEAQVNLPARCSSSCLQAWRTVCAVEPPFTERASWCEPLCALEVAERVLRAVAQEAPADDEAVSAPRPLPSEDTAGALLVVSVDGTGVPMMKQEAATLTATLGPGETRQRKKAALVGGSSTVDPQPRAPEALAELLVDPEAARARRQRAGTRDEAPRAQQVRRLASLGRPKPAGRERIKADAERPDPQPRNPVSVRLDGALGLGRLAPQRFTPWKRVTGGLDIRPVIGSLWAAAHAWCGAASTAGPPWVQHKLTAMLRGRVGDVIGGLRHSLTQPRRRTSGRQTRARVITFFQHHRRWMHYDVDLATGLPVGTGVVAISPLDYPSTDNFRRSYDGRYGMLEPWRRGRQGSVSRRGRERALLSTHVLPPRPEAATRARLWG